MGNNNVLCSNIIIVVYNANRADRKNVLKKCLKKKRAYMDCTDPDRLST